MDKKTVDDALVTYIDRMLEYCNKYDNIIILNKLMPVKGINCITLSDVYADFSLVSRDEYEKGKGKRYFEQYDPRINNDLWVSDFGGYHRLRNEEKLLESSNNTGTSNDNHINDTDEIDISVNGLVVLSEPGGGKTTYLKHLIYQLMSGDQTLDEDFWSTNKLDKNSSYFPVFVRTRDLDVLLKNNVNDRGDLFSGLVKRGIINILSVNTEDSIPEDSELLSKKLFSEMFLNKNNEGKYKKLIIIDGFEELDDNKAQKLLDCIEYAYKYNLINRKKDRLIISSRYKEYGYQKLVKYCSDHKIEEKFIIFDNRKNAISNFVTKWFEILKDISPASREYFNKMGMNREIKKLITTPLELTGLIMLCFSQATLPTDIASLYRSIIEIWLTYGIQDATIPVFSLSDIFLELSAIAYCMADSDDRQRISRDELVKIIETCREDLRRYYRSNSYVEASSPEEIKDLLDFWIKRNIFVKNSSEEVYEFVHREYQSFLISYAIVNNFIPEKKRREDRLDYLKGHMEQAEDFWDRVIIFSAFMDVDLHDDIIYHIFDLLDDYNSGKIDKKWIPKNIDIYYLYVILQLANSEGFYLDDSEYEKIFNELFRDISRIKIMKKSQKGNEIRNILSEGREDVNTIFLNKCIKKMEETRKEYVNILYRKTKGEEYSESRYERLDKLAIIEILGEMAFHVVWNCKAKDEVLKSAIKICSSEWITKDIIDEIKGSLESHQFREDRIDFIKKVGRDILDNESAPSLDIYWIIALICLYEKDENIEKDEDYFYKNALYYFEEAKKPNIDSGEKVEAITIAIYTFLWAKDHWDSGSKKKYFLTISEHKNGWESPLKEHFVECVDNICEQMKLIRGDCAYKRDLLETYKDLCSLRDKDIQKGEDLKLYDEDIILNCLKLSEEDSIRSIYENDISPVFLIIALFPLEKGYRFIKKIKEALGKRVNEIKQYKESDYVSWKNGLSLERYIPLLKLLIIAGYYDLDEGLDYKTITYEIQKITTFLARIGGAKDERLKGMINDVNLYLLNNPPIEKWGFFKKIRYRNTLRDCKLLLSYWPD